MRYFIMGSICLLVAGCATDTSWKDPDAWVENAGVYCYATLGGVDCYKRPIKRCVRQPIGYEGPPPPQEINE
jgi:hypothetical protein